jgi:multisubunit Na+/H+ antiporter MnhE subunit
MTEKTSTSANHAERLVRALLLLLCSAVFSAIAWAAGLYQMENQNLLFGVIGGIVVAAILVSRFGAKLVVRRLTNRASS